MPIKLKKNSRKINFIGVHGEGCKIVKSKLLWSSLDLFIPLQVLYLIFILFYNIINFFNVNGHDHVGAIAYGRVFFLIIILLIY